MRGPTKTQRMYGSALVEAALFERGTKGILDAALGHRLGGLGQVEVLPAFSWKQPHRIAMRAPVLKQQPERSLRQWHVAVFGAFAMTDVNHYPGTVEVGDLQMRPFLQAQTTGVDGGETDFVARQSNQSQKLSHFGHTEDDRQLPFGGWADDVESGPLLIQGVLKEELEPADGDGHSVARVVFDILQIEEVLAQLFLGDQVR